MSTEGEAAPAAAHERPVLPLPRPGDVLGDYRIVRELGRGGMGVVWLAEQVSSNRRVALKVLLPRERPTDAMLARFRREGQLAAAVSHPRCVFVFAADEVDGLPFIAMEAMPGRTLQSLVQERGRLPIAEAVDFALQLIDGLEAAASVGVIHRDVKPSNCFLAADGSVKIGDFGLSKSLQAESDLTATGSFVGTPLYASPEQVRGKPLDLRSDIYSLGATLYYLIAGEPPITRAHAGDLLTAIAMEKPAPLRRHRDRVPPALERIVRKMLAKDPAQRFGDYGSLRRTLEPYGSGAGAAAPVSWRVGAYLLDFTLLLTSVWAFEILALEPLLDRFESPHYAAIGLSTEAAIALLFFLVSEGLFRRSPGKALVGLAVGSKDGTPPQPRRAALRTLVYWVLTQLPYLTYFLAGPEDLGVENFPNLWHLLGHVPLMLSLGRGSDCRGVHELLSGTRVFIKPEPDRYPSIGLVATPVASSTPRSQKETKSRRLGPYELGSTLLECKEGALFSARDRILDRDAWVFVGTNQSQPISDARKSLFRPSRLRWLQGDANESERWDAFETPSGRPLLDVVAEGKGVPWREAQHYLLSLARELRTASDDGSLPAVLAPRHVRLLPRGEVQLLDPVLMELPDGPAASSSNSVELLRETAAVLLTGRAPPLSAPSEELDLPLESVALFRALDRSGQVSSGIGEALELLKSLNRRRRMTRRLRLCTLLAPSLLFGMFASILYFPTDTTDVAFWTMQACRDGQLVDHVSYESSLVMVSTKGQEWGLASRGWWGGVDFFFPEMPEDDPDSKALQKMFDVKSAFVRAAQEAHPAPSIDEQQWAETRMRAVRTRLVFWDTASCLATMLVSFAAVVLAFSWVLRGGAMPFVLGLQLLDARGRSASRLRCAFRALCAWGPSLALAALALGLRFWIASPAAPDPLSWAGFVKTMWLGVPSDHLGLLGWLPESIFVLSIAVLVSGSVHALYRPDRPLPERMSGTRLVPRS